MQIQFDFNGKKDKRITFAVDDELDTLLKAVAKKLRRDDVSCLAREYVIECATRDMGKLMLMEALMKGDTRPLADYKARGGVVPIAAVDNGR